MNEMQVFQNPEFGEIRTLHIDGDPWFVAADVCRVLEIQNATQALDRLDADERSMFNIGRQGNGNIVNESGLYSLVLGSRKPEAKTFKRWITKEVIPSIRKHGAYMTPAKIEEVLLNPDTIIKLAQNLKAEQEKVSALSVQVAQRDQIIGELKPKADYCDSILQNPGLTKTTIIAKDYGMTARAFNAILHELGVQYKQGKQWILYKKHQEEGYAMSITYPFGHGVNHLLKWTQKGRLFLYELLKQEGILPLIERPMAG